MKTIRFTHPSQPNLFAEVVLVSRHPDTGRLVYTLHLRYPRIIHGELMTHRVFSRNARSSRAVPVAKMLEEIRNDPFVPWHWTRNQPGMQGVDGWNEKVLLLGSAAQFVDCDTPVDRAAAWLHGRDMACDLAESFAKAGYHKQLANRLTEPFSWMDTLVTSTHWANFSHLRDHPAAEGHLHDLAVLVGQALEAGAHEAQDLAVGDWHLPYITDEDWELAEDYLEPYPAETHATVDVLKRISAARCARISYKPFDGDPSHERELQRYDHLAGDDAVHASPMEHQCSPDTVFEFDDDAGQRFEYANAELHGNLTGFIQFRKTITNEAIHD